MKYRICITGIGSTLAQSFLDVLVNHPLIEEITGLDNRDYHLKYKDKIRFVKGDVRNSLDVNKAIQGCNILIHTAFVVINNVPNDSEIYDINVNGSKNVFNCAADNGVQKIIYTSSVAAYGLPRSGSKQEIVYSEESPLHGCNNPMFYYGYTKCMVEKYLDEFEKTHPNVKIVRLRPHIISGANFLTYTNNMDIYLSQISNNRKYCIGLKSINRVDSQIQLTSENDLADIVLHSILNTNFCGIFNVVGKPLDLRIFMNERSKKMILVPWRVAMVILVLFGLFSRKIRLSRRWLLATKYGFTIESMALRQKGFLPTLKTTEEVLKEAIEFKRLNP